MGPWLCVKLNSKKTLLSIWAFRNSCSRWMGNFLWAGPNTAADVKIQVKGLPLSPTPRLWLYLKDRLVLSLTCFLLAWSSSFVGCIGSSSLCNDLGCSFIILAMVLYNVNNLATAPTNRSLFCCKRMKMIWLHSQNRQEETGLITFKLSKVRNIEYPIVVLDFPASGVSICSFPVWMGTRIKD